MKMPFSTCRKTMAILLLLAALGCKQSSKWPESPATQGQTRFSAEQKLPEKYNEYLLLMDENERMEFFKLETDEERDRFLQAQGIQQKKYLQDHLQVGMPEEKVAALQELGQPLKTEVDRGMQGTRKQWIYDTFNGYRHIRYAIAFENDKVVEWKVWRP